MSNVISHEDFQLIVVKLCCIVLGHIGVFGMISISSIKSLTVNGDARCLGLLPEMPDAVVFPLFWC